MFTPDFAWIGVQTRLEIVLEIVIRAVCLLVGALAVSVAFNSLRIRWPGFSIECAEMLATLGAAVTGYLVPSMFKRMNSRRRTVVCTDGRSGLVTVTASTKRVGQSKTRIKRNSLLVAVFQQATPQFTLSARSAAFSLSEPICATTLANQIPFVTRSTSSGGSGSS
jgi:hypothetical protein